MDKIGSLLRFIFLEKHEIIYNFMMILLCGFVFVLINWLRKAYRVLDSGNLAKGDPEALKKFTKDIDSMFAETKNGTAALNRKVDDVNARLNKWDTQLLTFQKGLDDFKKQLEAAKTAGSSAKAEELVAKMQSESKELLTNLNKRIEDLYEKTHRFNEQFISNQRQIDDVNKNFTRIQGIVDEANKNFAKVQGVVDETGRNSGKVLGTIDDVNKKFAVFQSAIDDSNRNYAKVQGTIDEVNKKFAAIQGAVDDSNRNYAKVQGAMEEVKGNFAKVQGNLTELSKQPHDLKSPDLDKFGKNLEETSKYVHKVHADIEHLHNKLGEHEDQINDLKRIFEDMDATFAEMNKRFQKIETVEQGN